MHRNLEPEKQAALVKWVRKKIHYGGKELFQLLIFVGMVDKVLENCVT